MKKVLLLMLIITLAFTLTGCRSTEEKIQDLFDNYTGMLNSLAKGEEPDVEKICNATFIEADAEECIDEFATEFSDDSELPYFFEITITVLSFEEVEDSLLDYEVVYLVTVEGTHKYKETVLAELEEDTYESEIYVVKEDGKLRLVINTPTE